MSTPAPADLQPAIAAAVIVHEGKILLVKRRISEGTLTWQFPAGAVESGENAYQAAEREAQEETGLTVAGSAVLGTRTHPQTGRTMIYVACTVRHGATFVADPDELSELCWSSKAELSAYVPGGFYAPVQEYLHANLA